MNNLKIKILENILNKNVIEIETIIKEIKN